MVQLFALSKTESSFSNARAIMAAMGSLRTADCLFNLRYIFSGIRIPILTLETLTGLFTSFPLTSLMTNLLAAFFSVLLAGVVDFADIFHRILSLSCAGFGGVADLRNSDCNSKSTRAFMIFWGEASQANPCITQNKKKQLAIAR